MEANMTEAIMKEILSQTCGEVKWSLFLLASFFTILKMPLTSAEKSKRYRDKLKESNPEKYGEIKKKSVERAIKSYNRKVANMTAEQMEERRRNWRSQNAMNKEKQNTEQNNEQSSSTSQNDIPLENVSFSRTIERNMQRRIQRNLEKENTKLRIDTQNLKKGFNKPLRQMRIQQQQIVKMNQNYENILKKLQETPGNDIGNFNSIDLVNETPHKKTENFVSQLNIDTPAKQSVKKVVFEHNVLTDALKEKYKSSSNKGKSVLKGIVDANLVNKYKMKTKLTKTLGLKTSFKRYQTKRNKNIILRKKIIDFYERDDVSRASAGKKECKTFKKSKKQKRYLLDKLKNLHKMYIKEIGNVSFSTFKKYRPFYIVAPRLKDLETCACIKHSNIQFKINALKSHYVFESNDLAEVISKLVCDRTFKDCMYGACDICSENAIEEKVEDIEDASWFTWTLKDHEYTHKGNLKKTKKMVKIKEKGTVNELIKIFNKDIRTIKIHVFNMIHQYQQYKKCTNNLDVNEVAIHIDFSENWVCKHSEEIQATHFGSSKSQVTLHTGVLYIKNEKPVSFCTISPDNSHNPEAIWAHLKPILNYIKLNYPRIDALHFFSDGPTSQYRQKKNFFLFSDITYQHGFNHGTWSFFEASHGKGAADGIGGAIKRALDFKVAHGFDIPDANTAFDILSKTESTIKVFYIEAENIKTLDSSIVTKLTPIPDTMKIHQIVLNDKHSLTHRVLSCFCGNLQGRCGCYSPKLHKFEVGQETENDVMETYYLELDENTGDIRKVRQDVTIDNDAKNDQIDGGYDIEDYDLPDVTNFEEMDIDKNILNNSALLDLVEDIPGTSDIKHLKRKKDDPNGHLTSQNKRSKSQYNQESSEDNDEDEFSVHDTSSGLDDLDVVEPLKKKKLANKKKEKGRKIKKVVPVSFESETEVTVNDLELKDDSDDGPFIDEDEEMEDDGVSHKSQEPPSCADSIPNENEFVVVDYEGEMWPGQVHKKEHDGAYVKCMARCGLAWKWPEKDDIIFYPIQNIRFKIKEPKKLSTKRAVYHVPELEQRWGKPKK